MSSTGDGLTQVNFDTLKYVSSAVRLEEQGRWQDAYQQYVQCCLKISTALMQDANRGGNSPMSASAAAIALLGNGINTPSVGGTETETNRMRHQLSMLGKQCFERLAALCKNIDDVPVIVASMSASSPSTPTSTLRRPKAAARTSSPGLAGHGQGQGGSVAPARPLRESNQPDPVAVARRDNARLKLAYEQRMEQMRRRGINPASVQLELHRKMTENLELAKSKATALSQRIELRRTSLRQSAIKRLKSLKSDSEKDSRENLNDVLEFEDKEKWLQAWRIECSTRATDPDFVLELTRAILTRDSHPITVKVNEKMAKIKRSLGPLYERYGPTLQRLQRKWLQPPPPATSPAPKSSAAETNSPPTEVDNAPQEGFLSATEDTKKDLEKAAAMADSLIAQLSVVSNENGDSTPSQHENTTAAISGLSRMGFGQRGNGADDVDEFDDLFQSEDYGITVLSANQQPLPASVANQGADQQSLHGSEVSSDKPSGGDGRIETGRVGGDDNGVENTNDDSSSLDEEYSEMLKLGNTFYQLLEIEARDMHTCLLNCQAAFLLAYEELSTEDAAKEAVYQGVEYHCFSLVGTELAFLYRLDSLRREKSMAVVLAEKPSLDECGVGSDWLGGEEIFKEIGARIFGEFLRVNSPLEKLAKMVELHRVVCDALNQLQGESVNPGADDLLPIICYTIASSSLPEVIAHCDLLEEFITPDCSMEEEGYCLSTLEAALQYLLSLDKSVGNQSEGDSSSESEVESVSMEGEERLIE